MDSPLLEGCIQKALPNLPDSQVQSILSVLDKLGVETEDDLHFVQPSDLENLPPVKARKLLQFWKNKGKRVNHSGSFNQVGACSVGFFIVPVISTSSHSDC